MKLLIAYDGSKCSESALDDLLKAGLPEMGEARVITVAEVWLPPTKGVDDALEDARVEELLAHHREKGEAMLETARQTAQSASDRLRGILPNWNISIASTYGSPAWEILSAAEEFGADLIVVGSQGQSAISRLILGSISQKVLTEAHCSVRVARGKNDVDPSPTRVVVGFDSTKGAQAAVAAVAGRSWPAGSSVRLVSALPDASPSIVGEFIPSVSNTVDDMNETERAALSQQAGAALQSLRDAGLEAEAQIVAGSAKEAIVEFAETWDADSIFVGANAFGSRLERFLIGSTSSAVAARAHCTVEVVRQ